MPDPTLLTALAQGSTEPMPQPTDPATKPTPEPAPAASSTGASEPAPAPQPSPEPKQEPAKPAVPEKYEFKLPEGLTLDPKAIDAFTPIAKELGLTNDQAQKLVDLYVAQVKGFDEQIMAEHNTRVAEWKKQAEADSEYGGAKLAENLSVAKKALDTFGSRALRDFLDDTGLGNHPEIVRLFYKIGTMLREDRLAEGRADQSPTDLARRMFPSMPNP